MIVTVSTVGAAARALVTVPMVTMTVSFPSLVLSSTGVMVIAPEVEPAGMEMLVAETVASTPPVVAVPEMIKGIVTVWLLADERLAVTVTEDKEFSAMLALAVAKETVIGATSVIVSTCTSGDTWLTLGTDPIERITVSLPSTKRSSKGVIVTVPEVWPAKMMMDEFDVE